MFFLQSKMIMIAMHAKKKTATMQIIRISAQKERPVEGGGKQIQVTAGSKYPVQL